MRVAFFVHGFPPRDVGGVELYARALVGELGQLGLECVILAGSDAPAAKPTLTASFEDGIAVTRLSTPARRFANRALEWDPDAEVLIRQFLVQSRPDLVHVQQWLRLSPRLVALTAELGIPAVIMLWDQLAVCPRIHRLRPNLMPCTPPYTEHLCVDCVDRDPWQGDEEIASALALRYRWIHRELALAARLVAPSESAAHLLSQLSGLPRSRFHVLPVGWLHGAPFTRAPAPVSDDPFKVGHWGHLHPYKGPHLLLLAARTLSGGPPFEIHFWGEPVDSAYGEYLSALAAGLRVTFHGKYRPPDLQQADLDVAAFPSLCWETHSFVLDEALALGLPVIVPDRGALAERIGANGITFQSGSVTDLSRALRQVARSIDTRQDLREVPARPIPSFTEHARAVLEVYQSVRNAKEVIAMPNTEVTASQAFLRVQVDERDRHLETLIQREAELREENRRLGEESRRLGEESRRLGEELARVRGSLEAELSTLRAELSEGRRRLAAAEATLKEIFASKGWRLLTILRRIKATLPGWR